MAYCTADDLLNLIPARELAQLTTESGDTPDAEVVAAAIARAEGEINSYLGKRYVLPLDTVPAQVKSLAEDVAAYHLYSRRGIMQEVRREKYKDAISFLKDIAAGRAEIHDLAGAEISSDTETVTEVSSQTRVFSRTTLGSW